MLRALGGDEISYYQLLEEMQRLLRPYLRARLDDEQAIADVSQEILLAVHRARNTFDPRSPIAAWFFAIVHYKIKDHFRSRSRRNKLLLALGNEVTGRFSADAPSPPSPFDPDVTLANAIAELPTAQRRAVELLKVEGLTTQEAANRLGVSLSALKVAAHRGYKTLRQKLRP
jgi:RNA polymerase sigma-70 factor (ECF subfamily)